MAKQKSRKRKNKAGGSSAKAVSWGGKSSPTASRLNILFGLIALAAVASGIAYWVTHQESEAAFLELVAEGRDRLEGITTHPNLGRRHLEIGESYHYTAEFPTSGPHERIWAEPGFYELVPPRTRIVHALEHGNIVIYYDKPGSETMDTLEAWTRLYGGQWDGLLAVPKPGLGEKLVLTAWVKELHQPRFDPAAAAAFIDKFRGRGPENPVR